MLTSGIADDRARALLDAVLAECPGVAASDSGWVFSADAAPPGAGVSLVDGVLGEESAPSADRRTTPADGGLVRNGSSRRDGGAAAAPAAAAPAATRGGASGRAGGSVSKLLQLVVNAESHRAAAERSAVTRTLGRVQGAGSGVWDHDRYMASGPNELGRRSAGAGRGSLLQHLLGADEGATRMDGATLGGTFTR